MEEEFETMAANIARWDKDLADRIAKGQIRCNVDDIDECLSCGS